MNINEVLCKIENEFEANVIYDEEMLHVMREINLIEIIMTGEMINDEVEEIVDARKTALERKDLV